VAAVIIVGILGVIIYRLKKYNDKYAEYEDFALVIDNNRGKSEKQN